MYLLLPLISMQTTTSAPAQQGPENGLDPAASAWVENAVTSLGLRQRVAQLIFPWIPGGRLAENSLEYRRLIRWIEEDQVGGLIVSVGPAQEFAPFLNELQRRSAVPLLILSDLETGPGMRLLGGTSIPPAMALGAADSLELAYQAGRLTAIEARAAGIHVTLGPVLDVNSNPRNPIINTRSFGEDPNHVARIAAAWIAGAQSEGLLSVGKHFPGHGATEVDSHDLLPTTTADSLQFASDLTPFRIAIQSGISGILAGHIAAPPIDGPDAPPASLSPRVVTGLLRQELGFDGLVITDAMNMGAILENYSVEEASILALQSGVDALLQPPAQNRVIDAVVEAVETGRLTEARLNEAVRRVLTAKALAGLHQGVFPQASGAVADPRHREVEAALAERSIALPLDSLGLVPLAADVHRIANIVYTFDGAGLPGGLLEESMRVSGREIVTVSLGPASSVAAYRVAEEAVTSSDAALISVYLIPRQSQGQLVPDELFRQFVASLGELSARRILVSFGSPYILQYFPGTSTYLIAWSASAASQAAAARALLGEIPILGKLPVSLPPDLRIGDCAGCR